MSSKVPAVKQSLTLKLREWFPQAGVSYGPPTDYPNQMVYLGDASVEWSQPTSGGSPRSRDEVVELEVVLSCFQPGPAGDSSSELLDNNPAVIAEADAYRMLDELEDHFRDISTATLDGLVREASVVRHEAQIRFSTAGSGEAEVITGRIADIVATVRTVTRI